MKNVSLQLAVISHGKLNAALIGAGLPVESDKSAAIAAVERLIAHGLITIDQVRAATPVTTAPAPSGANGAAYAERLRGIEADIAALSAKVGDAASHTDLTTVEDRISRKVKLAAGQQDVSAEVQKAVAAAFGAFKKKATKAEITEVAASLPPAVHQRTAADVFGVDACQYGNVYFGDLAVQVRDTDPALADRYAAVVNDYAFDPEALHTALIALGSKGLPHNTWLAGERGTGKTEFVTQLAARLNRPLFRVNFDEALERADFVGANTIEGGSVVWKEGVITQAVQTAGAIILLDEVGFARAQSVAILHSLCERSIHRSLTISETGRRITVAKDVVFFGADNSNGYGNTSGNFAGVREQNSAFLDRFGYTIRFDYLPPVKEAGLLVSRTGIERKAADIIVRFANVARQKAKAGALTQPPSLRQLFAWADAVNAGLPCAVAFKNAVINKYPEDCAQELAGIYIAEINEADFASALGVK